MGYDEVLGELQAGKAGSGLPCVRVRTLLNELGFQVKDKRAGHKTVTHAGIPGSDFISAGYNCKGGSGVVDRNYLGVLIRVVRTHETAIRRYLREV